MMPVLGIDVSHWDGTMDWAQAVRAGARYAWIKATESLSYTDTQFKRNWLESDGKLPRGAYHFWRASADPLKQARYFADVVGDDRGDLPPMLDVEDVHAPKMSGTVASDLAGCAAEIGRLFGRAPIVYTARWYWDTWIGVPVCLAKYDLAVAHYTVAQQPALPKGWASWMVWQKSADGNGRGKEFGAQSDDMDIDFFNGNDAAFMAWAGVGTLPLTQEQKVGKLWDAHSELHR
jgi:lysozyme